MYYFALLSFFALSTVSHQSTPPESAICLPYSQVQLRKPPTLFPPKTQPKWAPPPPAWVTGNWKVRYSSRPSYHALPNFEVDQYPVLPNNASIPYGYEVDLTSWSSPNKSVTTISTAFGYDTPQPHIGSAVYLFNGTGVLASTSNYWEVLAWGYDSSGVGFRIEYETDGGVGSPPCINFLSREEGGPSNQTVGDVRAGLRKLFAGDDELDKTLLAISGNVTRLVVDGRRSGMTPVTCDVACTQNTDLIPS